MVSILSTVIFTIIYLSRPEYNWLVFFMAFLWGFQDGSVNTHCLEILGFEFDEQIEPFSIFMLINCIAVFCF